MANGNTHADADLLNLLADSGPLARSENDFMTAAKIDELPIQLKDT